MQKVYAAKEKDIAVKYDANGFYMEELLPGTYREVYATINVISEPEVRYHPDIWGGYGCSYVRKRQGIYKNKGLSE